jgi:hypothetical protein
MELAHLFKSLFAGLGVFNLVPGADQRGAHEPPDLGFIVDY